MSRELVINAPPLTHMAFAHPHGEDFLFQIAKRALDAEAKAESAEFMPLMPNRLTVTPYIFEGVVKYVLDSSVELAEAGRCQVRQQVVETARGYVGITEILEIKNSDTGNFLEPFDQLHGIALALINEGFAMESGNSDPTEF